MLALKVTQRRGEPDAGRQQCNKMSVEHKGLEGAYQDGRSYARSKPHSLSSQKWHLAAKSVVIYSDLHHL